MMFPDDLLLMLPADVYQPDHLETSAGRFSTNTKAANIWGLPRWTLRLPEIPQPRPIHGPGNQAGVNEDPVVPP